MVPRLPNAAWSHSGLPVLREPDPEIALGTGGCHHCGAGPVAAYGSIIYWQALAVLLFLIGVIVLLSFLIINR